MEQSSISDKLSDKRPDKRPDKLSSSSSSNSSSGSRKAKQEEAKQEEAKQEEAKPEKVKKEEVKKEEVKKEEVKKEEVKKEEVKKEEVKKEEVKKEEVKKEEVKKEEVKKEEVKKEEVKKEEVKKEEVKKEEVKKEEVKKEEAKKEDSKSNAPISPAENTAIEAETTIIGAYKTAIKKCNYDSKANDFVSELFREQVLNKADRALQAAARGIFKALYSQYGNKEINDNLQKVKAQPTIWEYIKHFISKLLIVGLIIGTNVDDKRQYTKSFAEYTKKTREINSERLLGRDN